MKTSQSPKVLVVSNLYPSSNEQDYQVRSFAIKALIDAAIDEGLHVIGIVRLPSILRMRTIRTRY